MTTGGPHGQGHRGWSPCRHVLGSESEVSDAQLWAQAVYTGHPLASATESETMRGSRALYRDGAGLTTSCVANSSCTLHGCHLLPKSHPSLKLCFH